MTGKRRNLDDDPAFAELRERIARLETETKWMNELLKKVDSRTYYILASVLLGIMITLLTKFL
jgi:hypothetical protein